MKTYPRVYTAMLREHLETNRQMAFVSGPRQVGKTTVCRELADVYLNWDNENDRDAVLRGPEAVADLAGLQKVRENAPVIAFDELHKYGRWKRFLKGFFDVYERQARVILTGSSRLDVDKRGGDSLMGRYFQYRMHPFSVAELVRPKPSPKTVHPPVPIPDGDWEALLEFGGYPEPFSRREARFCRRWKGLRRDQLLREDVRELTRIQELSQMAALADIMGARSGEQVVYSSLASQSRVSENTVRAWLNTLVSLHYGFMLKPWHRNVTAAIRKEPKWFLRDWADVPDPGKRAETLVACHLLKAAEGWTDLGLGRFELHYIRDKQKREVDFLMTQDGSPWFLVEVKTSDTQLSPALDIMQRQTGAKHAFQAVLKEPYVEANCFRHERPIVVSARALLSQLF